MGKTQDNAGVIIDTSEFVNSIVKTATTSAAKLANCTAIRIIPLIGVATGTAIDVIVDDESFEQAFTSQLFATVAAEAITGIAIVSLGTSIPALLAVGFIAGTTYLVVDSVIDFSFWAVESLAIRIADQCSYASTTCTPIILDLDGDGVETIPLAGNVYFDHAGDGFAEQTGWVSAEDGLLVRDLNNNGTIDTGAELFGNNTVLTSGRLAATGFAALAELDANRNGRIDAADPAFAGLRIWKDANANGRTENGELHSLAELGIASISASYTASSAVDENSNIHRQIGSYTTTDGTIRAAADVFFKTDLLYSTATEWLDVPEDIQTLPDISGYGKMRSLHQAMVRDASLKDLVTQFAESTDGTERQALTQQILYKWAGVENISPWSRTNAGWGNTIGDARKLEVLEEFIGREWSQPTWGRNPGAVAGGRLLQAYEMHT